MSAPSASEVFGPVEPDGSDGSFHGKALGPRLFSPNGDGRYSLLIPQFGITIEVDRLRRERHELWGELQVTCDMEGANTVEGGSLSLADFNMSSAQSRTSRAKLVAGRSKARDLDWEGMLEEFCQRVIKAERQGAPAVHLRDLPEPDMTRQSFGVYGLTIPQRHPSILFGDGGSAKSYLALGIAGHLAEDTRVAYFDWELDANDHRYRLGKLFVDMPDLLYVKCDKPLVHDIDRMKRIVEDEGIDYAVFDSIVFACNGPAENSDIAAAYLQAVRRLNIGSMHVAHISKAEGGDQKPFGSAFWHNGARATWNVKREDIEGDPTSAYLLTYPRKANLTGLGRTGCLKITFGTDRVTVTQDAVANTEKAIERESVWTRCEHVLQQGQASLDDIKNTLRDEKRDSIKKAIERAERRGDVTRTETSNGTITYAMKRFL